MAAPMGSTAALRLLISTEHVTQTGVLVEVDEGLGGQAGGHVFWPYDWPREDRPPQLVEQLEVVCKHQSICQRSSAESSGQGHVPMPQPAGAPTLHEWSTDSKDKFASL